MSSPELRAMMTARVSVFVLAMLVAAVSACVAPDCENNDCGSCGNACCKLQFKLRGVTDVEAANAINRTISGGGPDGRYFVLPLAGGGTGVADLRKYNISKSFVGQTIHTTLKRQYNDTIDFNIAPGDGSGAVVDGFSISQIGGALCDDGQNYKNIVTLMKAICQELKVPFSAKRLDGSCPPPSL